MPPKYRSNEVRIHRNELVDGRNRYVSLPREYTLRNITVGDDRRHMSNERDFRNFTAEYRNQTNDRRNRTRR
jgi:hypothetical protein